jgi:hypothetical protein
MTDDQTCPDCGAEPGDLHTFGCDVERCPACGGQLISCGCFEDSFDQDSIPDRMPWTGEWPGLQECREFDFWCIRNPDGPGYIPCDKDHPEATEDLNRLVMECVWDRKRKHWVKKD